MKSIQNYATCLARVLSQLHSNVKILFIVNIDTSIAKKNNIHHEIEIFHSYLSYD